MAEIIAIVVCGLVILAFLLACYVMIRNAQLKKKMNAAVKKSTEMSFDRLDKSDGSFVNTR